LATVLQKHSPRGQQIVVMRIRAAESGFQPAKWKSVSMTPLSGYIITNIDEMEPGTFKDRIMTRRPHMIIEGTILADMLSHQKRPSFLSASYENGARILER
jgi:NADH:ubiquinone oxidoreductase subunit F (NADH-binding)